MVKEEPEVSVPALAASLKPKSEAPKFYAENFGSEPLASGSVGVGKFGGVGDGLREVPAGESVPPSMSAFPPSNAAKPKGGAALFAALGASNLQL